MTGAPIADDAPGAGSLRGPEWSLVSIRDQGNGPQAAIRDAAGSLWALPYELDRGSLLAMLSRCDAAVDRLDLIGLDSLEPIEPAELDLPLRFPGKIICARTNYHQHALEMGTPVPEGVRPYFFLKPPTTTLLTVGGVIPIEADQTEIDWEAELGVVIGRGGRHLNRSEAMEAIAGCVVLNDVTDRARLRRQPPVLAPPFAFDWLSAKGLDASCPVSQGVVPSCLVPDPHDLKVRLWVNGQLQQDGCTSDMVADIPALLEAASELMTFEPGDILATGTPAGVGAARKLFLSPGDVMTAEVEGVGQVTNTIVQAPAR